MSRPFEIYDVEQRSEPWYAARRGRLTGSRASAVLAKGRTKGEESVVRRNERLRLALERMTGVSIEQDIVTPAMQAGVEREPLARAAYESLTGEVVQEVGFCAHRIHQAGCSPDGYLGDFTKLLSIKCRQPAAHVDFLRSREIQSDALAQIRHELWITGAEFADYFCFNPDFPRALQGRIVTVSRQQVDVDGYAAEALRFLEEVEHEIVGLRALETDEYAQVSSW